jgi:hypothetical protein
MEFTICIAQSLTVGDVNFLLHDHLLLMDRDPKDAPILLGRPALKGFRIVLINSTMDWEFERKKSVTEYSTKRFKRLLQKSPVRLYEIRACLTLPAAGLPSELPPPNTWQQCLARIQQLKRTANPYRPSGPMTSNSDNNAVMIPSLQIGLISLLGCRKDM